MLMRKLQALVAEGATVTVVTRPESSTTKALPAGVKVVSVAHTDVPALAATFKEHQIEVVVSTVGHPALPNQKLLGDAAKQAGVKLFFPSEYGYTTIGLTHGELALKTQFAEHLKQIGLPSARVLVSYIVMTNICKVLTTNFQTGGFITFIPWLTAVDSGKVKITGGKGDAKASFTDPGDIAGFIAYIITHLSPSELSDKVFRIEGEHASMLDIAEYYGLPAEHVDDMGDEFRTYLQTIVNSGKGSTAFHNPSGKELTGSEAANASNALWPGHHWKNIKEGLGL